MLNHEKCSEKKTVGIIGGMGPAATAMLFQKLIDYTEAENDAGHMHIVIDNNPGIPDRTTAILKGEDTPAKYIVESGKNLEMCGARLLLIPCNTSHYFYDEIQAQLNVTVVNMIAETAKVCLEKGYTKVGVLATTGTCKTHTYDRELKKFGIETVYPNENGQKKVMEIIYDQVKAGKKIDASIIDQTLKEMATEGAQCFILGCTELPFAIKNGDFGYHFLDSLDILARRAVELAGYSLKKKKI
ncbi:MAG: amino acid racemase [Lachnospiraceae bacterium]|nr:amino acid racemase [Lachnospiraceae bacterium]